MKFNNTNLLLHTSVTFTDQDSAFKGTAVLQNISESTHLCLGVLNSLQDDHPTFQ